MLDRTRLSTLGLVALSAGCATNPHVETTATLLSPEAAEVVMSHVDSLVSKIEVPSTPAPGNPTDVKSLSWELLLVLSVYLGNQVRKWILSKRTTRKSSQV